MSKGSNLRRLIVNRFSSINHADVTFAPLTILIGPQGSGKSLLCKILYFCQLPFERMFSAVEEGLSLAQFKEDLGKEFSRWFPPRAWGGGKFTIELYSGGYSVVIRRSSGRGGVKDYVTVSFEEEFEGHYTSLSTLVRRERQRLRESSKEPPVIYPGLMYGVTNAFGRQLSAQYGRSYPSSQTYIPAGRAFFTTVGRAVAAFEQGQMFDPVTARFGRLFIGLRERMTYDWSGGRRYYSKSAASEATARHKKLESVFGGKIKAEREELFVETPDGRTVPFNALSSGQQELLPLWAALDYYNAFQYYSDLPDGSNILYIEEPEAHLFPAAQAKLVEVLVSFLRGRPGSSQIIVSTHSPYILAKANNLIKAGSIGYRRRTERQRQVSAIVPKDHWILREETSAYSVCEGSALSIIEEDGTISSDYIDEISLDIMEENEKLLDVVYG